MTTGVGLRAHVARAAYSLALRLLQPLYAVRLYWRARVEPLYRRDVAERFGFYADAPSAGWVWVHAVSLGETRASAALIAALRERMPGMRLLLTHGTATGREAGAELLRNASGHRDRQTWLPYDTPGAVARFLAHFQPAVGVLMETEIWPNLLHAARQRGVPMVLASARLSEKSLRRGETLAALMRPAAESVALVLAQTDADARRLREAGAREVVVCGNLKFDLTPDAALLARGRAWRAALGRDVVLGAITREGEEALLLAAWRDHVRDAAAGETHARPLLVIVPRHPQRFDEVAALIAAQGHTLARRSSWTEAPSESALHADVWLGDSMREMPLYYAMAQLALLGGSFAPLGGQNLIEAAACSCPVVMGPHTFNFAQAAELSIAAGAAARVETMAQGVELACAWLRDHDALAARAQRATEFVAQHRGAAQRMADRIAELRTPSPSGRGQG
ncbi:MAG TPA: 3-deoxy-D-manno-octulosonic acid transferase [Burkholderiaceae bacterium]|nr:3-deoxy-D-manno-octulosonic acid transferase [Burkholderiaceae bacterium]